MSQLILYKQTSTPATPAADKISIFCNSSERLVYVDDTGTVNVPALQTTGTWTPIVQFGGAAVGVTYTTQVGRYIRLGDYCLAWGYAVLSSKGSSTGGATFATLPFNVLNVTNAFVPVQLWASNMASITGHLQGFATPNTAGITLSYLGTGTATTLTDANFNNTSSFMIQVAYQVA